MFSMLKKIISLFSSVDKMKLSTERTLNQCPKSDPFALFRDAGELLDKGDVESALERYLQVIQADPTFEKAFVMLGFLYKERGKLIDAKQHLGRAIELNPQLADAQYLLGTIAAAENDAESMVQYMQRSLELDPLQERIYLEFSYALFQLGRGDDATALIKKGLERFPKSVVMLQYLGNFYLSQYRHQEAFVAYEQALELLPNSVDLLYNFVICCMTLSAVDLALDNLARIQMIQPDHVMANFEEGLLRLQRGEYERGWKQFEWRWQTQALASAKFSTSKPKWDGSENIADKTILIRSEQGFGDSIQFCRFIPQLKQLGASVLFSTSDALFDLMKQVEGVDLLINDKEVPPNFDLYCDLMSLPLALKIKLQTIPLASGYLQCPSLGQQKWHQRMLEQDGRWKIGIVWAGNSRHTNDHMRSISFASIRNLFDVQANFTVLQKEIAAAERAELSQYNNVFFYGNEVGDFTDTAALIHQMDIVITVDTSVAHLSGAMGKPTWILISCFPDWRWLLETENSPWYDSVRLFRQNSGEPWEVVIQKLKVELLRLIENQPR